MVSELKEIKNKKEHIYTRKNCQGKGYEVSQNHEYRMHTFPYDTKTGN